MPSTVMMAILLWASLSLIMISSRRGPASRRARGLKLRSNPPGKLREIAWAKLPSRLKTSNTARMTAKMIQPTLRRGFGADTIITGGVATGGVEIGVGASPGGRFVSIMGETTAKTGSGQG